MSEELVRKILTMTPTDDQGRYCYSDLEQTIFAVLTSRWTDEKPSKPGWYWWKSDFDDADIQCVEIVSAPTGILVVRYNRSAQTALSRMLGQWSPQPIREPEEGR